MSLPAPIELPYFRDTAELPAPLPTRREIDDASQSELSPRRNTWGDGGGIRRIRDVYIVKFGATVTENEGNALLFIENNTAISAPRLYAMYRAPPSGHVHLVMEYIQGVDLESVWNYVSPEAKLSIAAQLQSQFTQLRSVNRPEDFIGGVCGGGMPDPIFKTEKPNNSINGPFRNAEEVGLALASASEESAKQAGRQSWISSFFCRHLTDALSGHKACFTHGDLHMRNILVERTRVNSSPKTAKDQPTDIGEQWSYEVKGIVDWESAGWYPAYWEYTSAMARHQAETDWPESVDTIIPAYPLEFSMLFLVLRELQFI